MIGKDAIVLRGDDVVVVQIDQRERRNVPGARLSHIAVSGFSGIAAADELHQR